ncbi:MAG: polysaccharide biosynthesis tyrosine autokinase [Cyclobacteriaceae bacterium]|nr:polysaccharide biosynthesis tyrosine autokinase [Cyclobacteriaceae bacterium]
MDNKQETIDFGKLFSLFRRNVIWLVIILTATNVCAYLFLRWTKPMYESSSELKLEIQSDATEFGIGGMIENKNLSIISGEIELLKSKLFFKKVIDSLDLSISYYTIGHLLVDEKYPSSPIAVSYKLKSNRYLDQKVYVEYEDDEHFSWGLSPDGADRQQIKMGQKVVNDDIEFTIRQTQLFENASDEKFYFTIHSEEALLNYLGSNLTVQPLNLNANTIKLSFQDHNPIKARDMINAINNIYIDYTQQEKSLTNKKKINWLNDQLEKIGSELESFEDYFEDFTITNRTSDLNSDLKNTITLINVIDSQRYEIKLRLEILNELHDSISNQKPIPPSRLLPSAINSSINKLSNLIIEKEQMGLAYKETTFAMQQKSQEIEGMRSALNEQINNLTKGYNKELKDLNARQKRLESRFTKMPGKNTEFNKNLRFYNLYEEFFLSLMHSKAEFEIAIAGLTPDFKVLSPASYPHQPIYPNKLMVYGTGMITGLMFSLLFVGIKYILDNKVNNIEELENLTQTPVLGGIPLSKMKLDNSRLIVHTNPKSGVSESLRSIRTNIQFMLPNEAQKVIAITSSIGGEGKTFMALNLAGIIALSKKKVILLDLDMRKPKIHYAFDEEIKEKGVSTILISKNKLKECIKPTEIEGFDYIPSGPIPPNPAELLLNPEFAEMIVELKKQYDIIILDTPPIGLVTDGVLAMQKADLTLQIVRANYTKKRDLNALQRFTHIEKPPVALILNCLPRVSHYGYHYGYYSEN